MVLMTFGIIDRKLVGLLYACILRVALDIELQVKIMNTRVSKQHHGQHHHHYYPKSDMD